MKFAPIIHNLTPSTQGYAECQFYNNLIGNRPTGDGSLSDKIAKIRAWENLCSQALEKARAALKGVNK